MVRVALTLVSLVMISSSVSAEKPWNQFRGPTGDGGALESSLPVSFSETKNVRWKTAIPGVGWSSPVTWKDQVWVTSGRPDGRELYAICLDVKSGKITQQVTVFEVTDPSMEWSMNPHACPTPFVQDGRIFVHYGSYGTACIETATGKILWKRQDLPCNHRVGPASSPIVDDNLLFLQFDGVDVQYVAALEVESGDVVWKTERAVTKNLATRLRDAGIAESEIKETLNTKPGDNRKSYATPTVIEFQGRRQLISPGAEVLYSYDPGTGQELWRVEYTGWSWNVACRPVFANGMVFATNGLGKALYGIRPDGEGNVTTTHVEWSSKRGVPNMSSPAYADGRLFMVTDNGGIATCVDASDGREVWRKRMGGNHWASPVLAGGKLYFTSKEGEVVVLEVTDEKPKTLAKNRLQASFIASPAVVGDALLLRSTTHLYRMESGFERTAEQVAADVYPMKEEMPAGTRQVAEAKGKKKKPRLDLAMLEARLKAAVEAGKLTEDEAKKKYMAVVAAMKGKSKKGGLAREAGETNFYAIVIGRLKTKDVELGEFTLQVDYVTSMYGNRWVRDKIVGETVRVTGVSGKFGDQLLLVRRGQTLKFRSGSYLADKKTLTFGSKFHVLERTTPFDPAAYGVPDQDFRGFAGVLEGEIQEIGGYEILLRIHSVAKITDTNKAKNPAVGKGKLIRIVGFYGEHDKAYQDLHEGDVIRVGVRHNNPEFDEYEAAEVLETIAP